MPYFDKIKKGVLRGCLLKHYNFQKFCLTIKKSQNIMNMIVARTTMHYQVRCYCFVES